MGLEIRADIVSDAQLRLLQSREVTARGDFSEATGLSAADGDAKLKRMKCDPVGEKEKDRERFSNLAFLACNFAASAQQLFDSLPDRSAVRLISFQVCDFPFPTDTTNSLVIVMQCNLFSFLTPGGEEST